jgi:hypothetical protein
MPKKENIPQVFAKGRPLIARVIILVALYPEAVTAQYNTPNTDPVTRDDCEIIATVTATQRVNALSFASFGAACDWAKLKKAVPTTTATTDWRTFFRKPEYDSARKHAKVSYSESYNGANGMYGSHAFDCTLAKKNARWEIERCSMGVIVN